MPQQKYIHWRHEAEKWGAMGIVDHFRGSFDLGAQITCIIPDLMEDETHQDWFHPYLSIDIFLGIVQVRTALWLNNKEEKRGRKKADGGDSRSSSSPEDMQKVPD